MDSNMLSRPGSGFMIVVHFATSFITVILAIVSLGLSKNVADQTCELTEQCSSFFYALPAIATPFSIITLILALIQVRLYYTRAITGAVVCISSTFAAILWLVVIAIGWSPINVSYDTPSSYNFGVSGWFLWIRDLHSQYQTLVNGRPVNNEWQPIGAGSLRNMQDTNTINFSFGLLVMTHIIFILSVIMAVFGLAVHLKGRSDGKPASKWAASKTATTNKGPWVHPHALADKKAEEPMS